MCWIRSRRGTNRTSGASAFATDAAVPSEAAHVEAPLLDWYHPESTPAGCSPALQKVGEPSASRRARSVVKRKTT